MATKKELEAFVKDIMPLFSEFDEIKEKHGAIIREYRLGKRIVTEEERNEAAIEIIQKYSNL